MPVAVVLTQTQTALARERSGEEYRECLTACQRAAQRMRGIIDGLLALARLDTPDSPAMEPCDLLRIATETVEIFRPLAEENNVRLEIRGSPTGCSGNSDMSAVYFHFHTSTLRVLVLKNEKTPMPFAA